MGGYDIGTRAAVFDTPIGTIGFDPLPNRIRFRIFPEATDKAVSAFLEGLTQNEAKLIYRALLADGAIGPISTIGKALAAYEENCKLLVKAINTKQRPDMVSRLRLFQYDHKRQIETLVTREKGMVEDHINAFVSTIIERAHGLPVTI